MTPGELRAAVNGIHAALEKVPAEGRLDELKRLAAQLPDCESRDAAETLILTTEHLVEADSNRWEKKAALGFGIVFIVVMLILAIFIPQPTRTQFFVFRVVLALAAAGIAWFIPGFIDVRIKLPKIFVRATGAIAVFVLVYLVNPPGLVV